MLRIINKRMKNPESNRRISNNHIYHPPAPPPQRYWVLCYECPLCYALLVHPEHGHHCPCKSKEDQKTCCWALNPPMPPPQQTQSLYHHLSQSIHQNTQQPPSQQQCQSPRPSQSHRQLRKHEVHQRPNWDNY